MEKQFEPAHGRKPVAIIQNWIPYISNTIRYCLINYNKEVYDYDFLPLPNRLADKDSDEWEEMEIERIDYSFRYLLLRNSITLEVIHNIITSLPEELSPYYADILYYIRKKGRNFVNKKYSNFVIIGANIFKEEFCRWMK